MVLIFIWGSNWQHWGLYSDATVLENQRLHFNKPVGAGILFDVSIWRSVPKVYKLCWYVQYVALGYFEWESSGIRGGK